MHILYVDESGDDGFPQGNQFPSTGTPSRVFIRTGIIIHDRKWRRTNSSVDQFKYDKGIPKSVELHATAITRGRKKITDSTTGRRREVPNWYGSNFPRTSDRWDLLKECCALINTLDLTIICISIDKSTINRNAPNYNDFPKEKSWEFLIERYNIFLENATDKMGVIISDAVQDKIEKKHREFARSLYTQSSHINEYHFIESILFEPSDSSNLLQLVDIVSYGCFRYCNSNDETLFNLFKTRILSKPDGTIDGAGYKCWP